MENNTMNNTTPTTQLPLPAWCQESIGKEITVQQANELLAIARGNLLVDAFAAFDPIKRHRPLAEGQKQDYSSRFFGPSNDPDRAGIPLIEEGDNVVLEEGHGGKDKAVVMKVVKKDEFVGEYFPAVVPENAGIVVFKDPHGHGLIAVNTLCGDWGCIKSEPTREFSVVVYNTDGEENAGWVLASAYPGPQDETPDWSGLKEGDLVSSAEARRRHLRVRNIPIKDGKLVD